MQYVCPTPTKCLRGLREGPGQQVRERVRGVKRGALDETDDALVLEALNGEARCLAGQVRVRGEALPVAATEDGAAHGAHADRERDVSSDVVVLLAHGHGAGVDEVAVERGTGRDLGRELSAVTRVDACEERGSSAFRIERGKPVGGDAPDGPSAVQMP